jgi:transcriptional regulator GlxA family with amidase domain
MSAIRKVPNFGVPQPELLAVTNQEDQRISAVLDYLSIQELAQIPSIDSIAVSINLSLSRLRSIFKEQTGIPIACYVKHLRLQRAHILLQQSLLTVKQVMAQVGVEDHSHFSRDYKKQFGESPSQTRGRSAQRKTAIALTRHKIVNLATSKDLP